MKFGVEIPTCTAGMMYPVPFATAQDAVRVAAEAEQLGYYDVAGNDHLSTQQYVREAWPRPPEYFEPLITLGERRGPHVRRAPDHGNPGAFDARPRAPGEAGGDARSAQRWPRHARGRGRRIPRRVRKRRARPAGRAPGRPGDRGPRSTARPLRRAALDVSREVSAIRWTSSRFRSLQSPLPIYSGGNVHGSMRRAGRLCEGWLPAKIGPERVRGGRRVVCEYARQAGRDPSKICTALQSVACLGKAADEARQRFERSAFDLFRRSLEKTMTRGVDADAYIETNLIGTPDQVCRKVEAVEQAGVEHLCAILFVANTVYELLDQIRAFAREVIPALPERPRAGRTSSPLTPP